MPPNRLQARAWNPRVRKVTAGLRLESATAPIDTTSPLNQGFSGPSQAEIFYTVGAFGAEHDLSANNFNAVPRYLAVFSGLRSLICCFDRIVRGACLVWNSHPSRIKTSEAHRRN